MYAKPGPHGPGTLPACGPSPRLRQVKTRHQRCWVHKIANVANARPKSAQSGAKKALQEIYNAEDRDHALIAVTAFEKAYGAKFPKVVKKITDDVDELLIRERWPHATVRRRPRPH